MCPECMTLKKHGFMCTKPPKALAYILDNERVYFASDVEVIDDTTDEELDQARADRWIKSYKEGF